MKRIITSACILALALSVFGKGDSLSSRPFQLTFIYPLSTAGPQAVDHSYNLSINVISGVTGAAKGIELASISNINKSYNKGIQLGGICNINGTYNKGIQGAGICNITGSDSKGCQFAGISNIAGGMVDGMQIAGISNIAGTDVKGIQGAGVANIAGGISKSAQIAGVANIAEQNTGLQAAGVGNIAGEVKGAQIAGVFNVAGNVKGLQLAGVINICDSIDGVPIGLISIVHKNGYRRFDVWTSEVFPINITYKIGIRAFYTMFSLGYRPGNLHNNMGLGYGIGTSHTIGKRSALELEAHMYHINRYLWINEENYLYTLRLNYERNIWRNLSVYAGPTYNLMMTRPFSDAGEFAPGWAEERSSQNFDWHRWLGFNAGIRF